MVCDECKTCIHQFYCSCLDSSIRWNVCKHIHYLCKTSKMEKNTSSDIPDNALVIENNSESDIIMKEQYSRTI